MNETPRLGDYVRWRKYTGRIVALLPCWVNVIDTDGEQWSLDYAGLNVVARAKA